jgi:hypothetical protein
MNPDKIVITPVKRSDSDFGLYKTERSVHKFNDYENLPEVYLLITESFGEGIIY